jgi:subtilisin family serine protease
MKNLFFNKKKIGLLPYIREDIHSLTVNSAQQYGWELNKFNIPALWSKTDGYGVTVAVIDTGCDINHEDLRDNMLHGKNFVEPNEPPMDRCGHGSHVASTIAAINNGLGMVGVAPKTKILPVKALGDDGSGDLNTIVKAIRWAADQKVDFITMSLGSVATANILEKAVNYAADKGCIIFCAAGNSGPNVDVMYPAKYDKCIAIGAVDINLERTSFSCSGDSLDFLAPGKDILGCVPGNRYALMSGTSMSNPFAVGCASLLLSYNKKHNKYKLDTIEDYISVLSSMAIQIPDLEYRSRKYQGNGIINLKL